MPATYLPAAAKRKYAEVPQLSYGLSGRLYLSRSGWLLLQVPNALGQGAFTALDELGVELPKNKDGVYNAHISVIRPEELETIGGPEAVTERGKTFRYTLGQVRSTKPSGWSEMSRVWFIEVQSPELEQLRRSYGLPSLPNQGKFKFHITFAVRRVNTLRTNDVAKQ